MAREQRVFMGLAQAWRNKYRDEYLRFQVTVKPGDKMFRKPEDRVRIW